MPRAACTRVAVAGKVSSGVAVARTIRSRSEAFDAGMGERPLRRLDGKMRGELTVGAMWRCLMPVRCWIHSSDVSTFLASSSLLTTLSGR